MVTYWFLLMALIMRFLALFFTLFFSLQLSFQAHAELKLDNGLYAKMRTNQGNIIIKLAFEKAPLTVINFVGLAQGTKHSNIQTGKPFYNGLTFHRVIKDFMIQGGDPKGNGTGGPGYQFMDEITDLKHDKPGILSMANAGPNTNGSQFFITHTATPNLDGLHTVFGHVIKGMGIVNRIKKEDFIRKIKILRIGEKAKNFQTDEAAFQAQQKKYLTKKQEKITKFVKDNYPNAQAHDDGYFVQIEHAGSDTKPNKGDSVTINLSIKLDDGTIIRKVEEPITFNVGLGQLIKAVDQSILKMNVGEKRTVIMTSASFKNIPKDALVIFGLELSSVNQ